MQQSDWVQNSNYLHVALVNQMKPSVTTTKGKRFESDVVVDTDGIQSIVRECFFASLFIKPTSKANCASRAPISVEKITVHLQTAELKTDVYKHAMVGPDRHVMAYSIRQGAIYLYNLVVCHPGQAKTEN